MNRQNLIIKNLFLFVCFAAFACPAKAKRVYQAREHIYVAELTIPEFLKLQEFPLYDQFHFVMDNKNYTMYWSDLGFARTNPKYANRVHLIFISPDDYMVQNISCRRGDVENFITNNHSKPMEVQKIIYHKLPDEKSFIGVDVIEIKYDISNCKETWIRKEIRLPNTAGERLIDLLVGDAAPFWPSPAIKEFKTVHTAELKKPDIRTRPVSL